MEISDATPGLAAQLQSEKIIRKKGRMANRTQATDAPGGLENLTT